LKDEELIPICDTVFEEEASSAEMKKWRKTEKKMVNYLVGQLMKTNRNINARAARALIVKKLNEGV
jgi:Asp-tRNA(Asn)/Glu-tRNA(Gln) amidotransferase B subunit